MEYQGKSSMLAQAGIKQCPLEDESIFWQNASGWAIFLICHTQNYPQNTRKKPQNTRKNPQTPANPENW